MDFIKPCNIRLTGYSCMLAAIGLSSPVWAQVPTNDAADIVVVTGTKTERKLLDVPVRTEVVTAAELAKSHARDLAEGLKNVPGLLIKPIHGKSGQEVWLQGIDANRVLILVDGLPVTASTGSSVDLTQIAVADVSHVEIVKGAVSALYGSEAMGGVVNVITRQPQQELAYSLTLDSGSYGDHDVSRTPFNDNHLGLHVSKGGDNWFGQLTFDIRDKGGSDLDPDTWSFEGDKGDKTNLAGELGYRFDNGAEIKLKPSYYKEDLVKQFDTFVPGIGDVKKVKGEQATRKNIALAVSTPVLQDSEINFWYMHENFEDITQQDVVSTDYTDQERVGENQFDKAELQFDTVWGDNHFITAGIVGFQSELKQQQTKSSPQGSNRFSELNGQQNRHATELYLQDDIFITDEIEILPGLRYQYDSDFGSHTAPKINAMYRPAGLESYNGIFRAGVGNGYRTPTLKERHYIFDHSALGYMVIGNPDLSPESSVSFQLGTEFSQAQHYRADINLFYNKIKDLIDTDLNHQASAETGLQIFEYTNIGKATTAGVDLATSYFFTPEFSGDFAYSYLYAKDDNTNKHLTQRPEHQIKVKLNYHISAINSDLTLYGNYQSEEFIDSANNTTSPAYSTFDFKLNSQINDHFKVFVGLDNLTDTVRDTPATGTDFRPKTGRFVYAGFRIDG
ncbi:TonB-dependent receptor plug domain-containing protein [Motilimonas pumila]|nr:TonB-dependent receptor [Motilimonas pumila]